MISDSHTRYGSAVTPGRARQGRARRWRSYQASSAAGSGRGALARGFAGERGAVTMPALCSRAHAAGAIERIVAALAPRPPFRKSTRALAELVDDCIAPAL